MSETLKKLQKNVFLLTLLAAVLLGISFAYLGSVGLRCSFTCGCMDDCKDAGVVASASRPRANSRASFRPVEQFQALVTDSFFRNRNFEDPAAGTEGIQGATGEITIAGVLYAAPARYARAVIKEKGGNEAKSYRIGSEVAGFKVSAIHRKAVTVEVGGNRFKLKVGESSGEAQAKPAVGEGVSAAPASGDAEVVTLSRDRLKTVLQKPDALYKNKFAPVMVNDKIAGLRLIFVPPQDNFLYQLGARSGDIIRRFNGEPLESQDKMIQLYQSLQSANRVTVDLERGGKIFTYEIRIQ